MMPRPPSRLTTALLAALALAGLTATTAAQAGRSCDARRPALQDVALGLTLAQQTAERLDDSGAQVVLLARAGQDLSRWSLRYSHAGWAYRSDNGAWRVVHKLNHCGTATSHLYRQGLAEFFLDDLWRHEAVWMVPHAHVQASLQPLLQDNAQLRLLHEPRYSLVSYAWSTKYQQSNQWAIEALAQAMEPGTIRSRRQAQAWLQFTGYAPSELQIRALTRLGGRLTAANVSFDDHPNAQRFADRIDTVTVDSILHWLPRAQLADPATQSIRLR